MDTIKPITNKNLKEVTIEDLMEIFNIKPLNSRKYWLIRAGVDSSFFNEFYTRKFTGINIPSSNDIQLLKNSSKEELRNFIETNCPEDKNIGHLVGKLYNFIHEIKKGDIIIMPSSKKETIAFGTIEENDFYIDDSLILEESFNAVDEQHGIPNKRRKVKWLKLVSSTQLPAKLLLNLFSPHGLSAIADEQITDIIDSIINDMFVKDEYASMTFEIKTEESIDFYSLSNYLNKINDVISFTNEYFSVNEKVTIKLNLNSRGNINFKGPLKVLLAAGVILAFLGGDFEIGVEDFKFRIKTEGILAYVKAYLDYQNKKEEREYNKAIKMLEISQPEEFKNIIDEKMSEN